MFSPAIVDSDAFLDMPVSSQALYFHLGMHADDDGFVNPKRIMRGIGVSEDDLKVLVAKRFVLPFENGVVVIKHWRINNLVRKDWYKETVYLEEKSRLIVKENGSYSESGNGSLTKSVTVRPRRLGKVRLGKDITPAVQSTANPLINDVIKLFEEVDPKNKTYYGNTSQRKAADFLLSEYGFEEIKKRLAVLPKTNKLPYFPAITTPVQLRDKWVQLQDAVDRKRGERLSGKNGLA